MYISFITSGTVAGGSSTTNFDVAIAKLIPGTTEGVSWYVQNNSFNGIGGPYNLGGWYATGNASISVDSSENLYLTYGSSDGTGQSAFVLCKFNSSGSNLWTTHSNDYFTPFFI